MSNVDVPTILDDEDTYNISDIEDVEPFDVLRGYVEKFTHQDLPIIDTLLKGEDVNAKKFQQLLRALSPIS